MIVADTNLVVYFVVKGDFTGAAERVRSLDRDWVVPSLFRHELLNVLTTHVRTGRLDRDKAIRAFVRGTSLVRFWKAEPPVDEILNLALRGGCAGYDAEFVWLAEEIGCRLVTTDQQVINKFPDVAVGITEFSKG